MTATQVASAYSLRRLAYQLITKDTKPVALNRRLWHRSPEVDPQNWCVRTLMVSCVEWAAERVLKRIPGVVESGLVYVVVGSQHLLNGDIMRTSVLLVLLAASTLCAQPNFGEDITKNSLYEQSRRKSR